MRPRRVPYVLLVRRREVIENRTDSLFHAYPDVLIAQLCLTRPNAISRSKAMVMSGPRLDSVS